MPSSLKLSNNAIGRLGSNRSASDTTLVLVSGNGAKFPTLAAGEYCPATLVRASDGAIEIVKVTARSSDTLTVTRAQEGTAALAFLAGDRVELRLTAATFTDEVDRVEDKADAAQAAANTAQATADSALSGLTGKQNVDADLTDLATNGAGIGNNQYVKRDASARIPIGANWSVFESGGVLYFRRGTTNMAKLDASGNLTVAGDVIAFGTV